MLPPRRHDEILLAVLSGLAVVGVMFLIALSLNGCAPPPNFGWNSYGLGIN